MIGGNSKRLEISHLAFTMKVPPFPLHLLHLLPVAAALAFAGSEAAKVPAIYVFGDSTADVGNNNYLPGSNAKANFPHNGVDFPFSRPTGRFSNGYNGIDFLGKPCCINFAHPHSLHRKFALATRNGVDL